MRAIEDLGSALGQEIADEQKMTLKQCERAQDDVFQQGENQLV